jgi:NAD(P)-dependent dehydrogenase (short-subunit alcohol dehydrogenase family)
VSLAGRRIIVTGAASGIGRGAAHYLAAAGARVALLDRDAAGLDETVRRMAQEVAQEVAQEGGADLARAVADVADAGEARAAVTHLVAQLGGLDGLVNCAGIDLLCDFEATGPEQWQRLFGVNLMGPVNVCQAALAALRQGTSPAIVNVASAAALRPLPQRSAYCSSKAALVMFGKALAMDLAPDGIRVNSVCPGIVDTPMLQDSVRGEADPDEAMAGIVDRYLIKRAGTVQEVAAAIAFLLDDGAGYITGSALAVDGGRSFY